MVSSEVLQIHHARLQETRSREQNITREIEELSQQLDKHKADLLVLRGYAIALQQSIELLQVTSSDKSEEEKAAAGAAVKE